MAQSNSEHVLSCAESCGVWGTTSDEEPAEETLPASTTVSRKEGSDVVIPSSAIGQAHNLHLRERTLSHITYNAGGVWLEFLSLQMSRPVMQKLHVRTWFLEHFELQIPTNKAVSNFV